MLFSSVSTNRMHLHVLYTLLFTDSDKNFNTIVSKDVFYMKILPNNDVIKCCYYVSKFKKLLDKVNFITACMPVFVKH